MKQNKNIPENAIRVTTFKRLEEFVTAFAKGSLNLLVIIGSQGISKSRLVVQAVENACLITGHATPFGIYKKLWEFKDKPVVIDDVDELYRSGDGVRLLKCLCSTETVKKVMWCSNVSALKDEGIPKEFETTSRVCIIANKWKTLDENVAAVEDRGIVILFEPNPIEVHCRVAKWFWDQEIFDFIAERLASLSKLSMRMYYHAWELKMSGINWKEYIFDLTAKDKKRLQVWKLLRDPSYSGNDARSKAFEALGHGSRSTFYAYAGKIQEDGMLVDPPKIVLKNIKPPRQSPTDIVDILRMRSGGFQNS